ncbi:hypothetical protein [Streptobacillus notomytis]|uniref:hypothetical protein n=1 Tax=Streptobacillus notomytis TaxID=1712031 RepID=UPI00082A8D7D|nr:hypothetical protein [Streptobacillus notomytis]
MKKTLLALAIVLSAITFSVEAKYKLAEVEQSIIQAELTKIAEKGTLDLIYADFNNHVADLIKNEKSKNSKYDETKFENKKNLYILGLKHIFAQIGYESNFVIKELNGNKAEFKYYVDKTINSKDAYYLDKAVVEILNNLYQKPTEITFKLYTDVKLTKEKK